MPPHTLSIKGEEAPLGTTEWKSWKLARKCRSSLAAESQAMDDSVDIKKVSTFEDQMMFPNFARSQVRSQIARVYTTPWKKRIAWVRSFRKADVNRSHDHTTTSESHWYQSQMGQLWPTTGRCVDESHRTPRRVSYDSRPLVVGKLCGARTTPLPNAFERRSAMLTSDR